MKINHVMIIITLVSLLATRIREQEAADDWTRPHLARH